MNRERFSYSRLKEWIRTYRYTVLVPLGIGGGTAFGWGGTALLLDGAVPVASTVWAGITAGITAALVLQLIGTDS